jgi:hypothetical protein
MKALLIAVLVFSPAATLADDVPPTLEELPPECKPYADIQSDTDSVATWNQVLSFAACVQDSSIERIDNPDELPALIGRFELAHAPSMALYLAALEYGPAPVQLRAAFQIGLMQVALISRARASLVVPDDRKTNRRSAASYRELQQKLEPLLESPAKLAWTMFKTIQQAAEEDPEMAVDDVTRNMIRACGDLERSLRWSMSLPTTDTPQEMATTR